MRVELDQERAAALGDRRIAALRTTSRAAADFASGLIGTGSGSVNIRTSMPASRNGPTVPSISAATASTSTFLRSMSLRPESTLARSGESASAGSSCSARTCRASLPRTARFA